MQKQDILLEISKALAVLTQPQLAGSTLLGDYTPYSHLDDVPPEELPQMLRDLQQEVKCLQALGEPKYYASRTQASKAALYMAALKDLMQAGVTEYNPTYAEFRRMLSMCLLTVEPKGKAKRPPLKNKPDAAMVEAYALENNLPAFDIQEFMDHYEANGWKVGNVHMADWRAAARNWARRQQKNGGRPFAPPASAQQRMNTPVMGRRMAEGEQDALAGAQEYVPMKKRPAGAAEGKEN